jgi:hypothetical protein
VRLQKKSMKIPGRKYCWKEPEPKVGVGLHHDGLLPEKPLGGDGKIETHTHHRQKGAVTSSLTGLDPTPFIVPKYPNSIGMMNRPAPTFKSIRSSSHHTRRFIRLRLNTLQLATGMKGKVNRAEARQSVGGLGYGVIPL